MRRRARWSGAAADVVLAAVAGFPLVQVAILVLHAVGAPGRLYAPVALAIVAVMAVALRRAVRFGTDHAGEVLPGEGAPVPTWLLVAAGAVATLVLSAPILPYVGDGVVGGPTDGLLLVAVLDWQWYALTSDPAGFFDLNIFAPEPGALAWGPALTPYLLVFVPVRALTGSPLAGLNVSLIVVTALTIGVTFAFLRRLGFDRVAAGLGGVLYATTWERLTHVVHLESYATFWIPLVAILFLGTVERRRARDGLLLGLALAGAFLGGPYYFVATGLAIAVLTVVLVLRGRVRRDHAPALVAAAGVTAIVVAPFAWLSVRAGLDRDPDTIRPLSWLDPFSPGPLAPQFLEPLQQAATAGGATVAFEHAVHPGVVLAVLAALGAVVARRRRAGGRPALPLPSTDHVTVPMLVTLAVVGGLLALGPHLVWGGTRYPLPTRLLWELPGISSLRATPRLVALPYLGLTVLGTLGAAAAVGVVRDRRGRLGIAAALAAITLATSVAHVRATERFDVDAPATQVNRVLGERPDGVVLELPWPNCPGRCLHTEPARMVWARYDRMPRLGGYSGHVPGHWRRIQELSVAWTNPDVLRELRERWRVRYVILRTTAPDEGIRFTRQEAAALAAQLARDGQVERVEHVGPSWLVTLRPAEGPSTTSRPGGGGR